MTCKVEVQNTIRRFNKNPSVVDNEYDKCVPNFLLLSF